MKPTTPQEIIGFIKAIFFFHFIDFEYHNPEFRIEESSGNYFIWVTFAYSIDDLGPNIKEFGEPIFYNPQLDLETFEEDVVKILKKIEDIEPIDKTSKDY